MTEINAKKELLNHIADREVEYVKLLYCGQDKRLIEGTLEEVLPKLDLLYYDELFGKQYLYGYIWYKDGTWSEREEYDGSEWWGYKTRPEFDVNLDECY
jgi:hypothetical protein